MLPLPHGHQEGHNPDEPLCGVCLRDGNDRYSMGSEYCERCPDNTDSNGYRALVCCISFLVFLVAVYALLFRAYGEEMETGIMSYFLIGGTVTEAVGGM